MRHKILLLSGTNLEKIATEFTESLAKDYDVSGLSYESALNDIKDTLLEPPTAHLVIVLTTDRPKKLLQMLAMVKRKKDFAIMLLGKEELDTQKGVDVIECLPDNKEGIDRLEPIIKYLCQVARRSQNEMRLHQAKISLLTSLSELIYTSEDLDIFTYKLAKSLRDICHANSVYLFRPEAPHTHLDENDQRIKCENIVLPKEAESAFSSKEVKIHFYEDGEVEGDIGGSLSFPVICDGEVITLLYAKLSKDILEFITLDTISLLEAAGAQLRVILERLSAQDKLQEKHQELERTYLSLKDTKAQLYQTEKLASIGELAAGLAHEINNPLAYIYGNLGCLEDYIDTLLEVLDLHTKFITSVHEQKEAAEVEELKKAHKEADLDFLQEDIVEICTSSKDGVVRIQEIIKNLLSFSRQDSINKEPCNLGDCLESTLKLIKFKLDKDVTLETSLKHTQMVEAVPGLINQVFMNLFVNAIDAAEGKALILTIASWDEGDYQYFTVADNGSGIAKDKLEKIFDPFFTTKAVGKGTGLGLSMSYNIIKRHEGELSVESEEGKYTKFTIKLPLLLNSNNA